MSDQAIPSKAPPLLVQMGNPGFQALPYDEQRKQRLILYQSQMAGKPEWESSDDATKVQALKLVDSKFPPAFTDYHYERLRQYFEDPDTANKPLLRFTYSTGTQMGLTGLLIRGVVNTAKAMSDTLSDVESRVGKFFGANVSVPEEDIGTLTARAEGGDKDGVKLAQYLQRKYERTFPSIFRVAGMTFGIPLIGGQTPTQLLGSALGFGIDLLATGGVGEIAGAALKGAQALSPLARAGAKAAVTGLQGVIRGEAAEAVNAARPGTAPVEGATDTTHGIVSTMRSVGTLFGAWAAQDLAFGMLGQGAAAGLKNVGRAWLRAIANKGRAALPNADTFHEVIDGEYSPEAADLQRRFLYGNASPEALSQVGPATRDYATSIQKTAEYTEKDLLENPEAQWHFSMQRMMGGKPTPLGIAVNPDGPGTFRLRTGLGQKGEVLGEHLSLSEATMAVHDRWQTALDEARSKHAEWVAKYEKTGSDSAKQMVTSYQLRMNALQDAFPHDRAISDSLAIIRGNMDRFSPEGASAKLSEGAMLTYGEVGQLQGIGMKVAKTNLALDEKALPGISKRGEVVNSDAPTRFSPATAGDYNGAIVYSRAAPESVYQAALARANEYIKNGATSSPEDLAYWKLRNDGFDAIQHGNGDLTALYPRDQVKHVSDFVNKSSREYTLEPKAAPVVSAAASAEERPAQPATSKAPMMLGGEADKFNWLTEAADREANTRIARLPNGQYQMQMFGMDRPITGDLDAITDTFLTRSTTTAHLRASLESEGRSLKKGPEGYTILGRDGRAMGSGATPADAMASAGYRPKLIDGRFGPANVEVLPEGAKFEYSQQGVRGSLSDIIKYGNQFMDVAEEEGKRPHLMTDSGGVALGHDGAYTVEIPAWGIREKFSSAKEASDYLKGQYKEYDNVQRLANERGFNLSYDPKRGYLVSGAAGTYAVHSMDEVGKILAKTPDPRWAPGGQFEAGVTLKDSRDATRLPVDTEPSHDSVGKYYNRSDLGKFISNARSMVSVGFAAARSTMSRFANEFGGATREAARSLFKTQESIKTATNQSFVDAHKVMSLESLYRLNGNDLRVVEAVRQARDMGLGQEGIERVLEENGYKEGNVKRPQILDYADRLTSEFYNKVFERSGQNWDHYLKEFAQRKAEFQITRPQEFANMQLEGPDGMRQLIERLYGGRVPDDMKFMSLHERVSDVDYLLKEGNATVRAIRYAEMSNRWTYAQENMKDFYTKIHAPDVPEAVTMFGSHFIDQALNGSQRDMLSLMRALGSEGKSATEGSRANLISVLKGLAAAKIYGFRPSSAKTIIMHNYLLSTGILGTEATNAGFARSAAGGMDLLKEQFQKNVFSGRIPSIFDLGSPGGVAGWLGKVFNKITQASTYFVQNGHIIGRSSVYEGAGWLFDKYLKPWMDGGKVGDFEAKMHQVKGQYLDPGAYDQVEGLLGRGDYAGARHAYAQNMTDQIAFMFRPEDQGWALNKGIMAKMWGQLSIVPTQYASAIYRMASRGSFADRAQSVSTFVKNTAAFYGASRLAGLSGASLLPWHVVTLRGGPLWQGAINMTMAKPGQKFLKTAEGTALSLVPFVPQGVQVKQMLKDLESGTPQGDWAAFLTATGDSVSPDLQMK